MSLDRKLPGGAWVVTKLPGHNTTEQIVAALREAGFDVDGTRISAKFFDIPNVTSVIISFPEHVVASMFNGYEVKLAGSAVKVRAFDRTRAKRQRDHRTYVAPKC